MRIAVRSGMRAALLAGSALVASPALAQADQASVDARIQALQARLDRSEAEIDALRAELAALRGSATTKTGESAVASQDGSAAPLPGSAATAGIGQPVGAPSQVAKAAAAAAAGATAAGATTSDAAAAAAQAVAATKRTRIFGPGVPTSAATARIDAGHPVIATPDGQFTASLLGVMQFDVANYYQPAAGSLATDFRRAGAAADNSRARNLANGTNFRRARIGIAGRAFSDFEYTVLFDFGGSGEEDSGHIQELWLQYSGLKPANIRVGAFPPSIGLADAGSSNGMLFLERPAPADIARSLAGGDYREAAQIALVQPRWFASAAVSGRLVNTAGSSTVQPYNNPLGIVGRAALLAVRAGDDIVHLGAHGSYVAHPADTAGPDASVGTLRSPVQLRERPELRVDGTRLIDTGAIDALHAYSAGAEFAAQHRNLMLQAEYERIGIDRRPGGLTDPVFGGFYVEGSWIVTGERRRYNDGNFAFDGPQAKGSFNPGAGNWGVWEIAARYSDIDLNYHQGALGTVLPADGVRGGHQMIASLGVNWYLNSITRVMLDGQHVTIDRLSPNAAAYLTPIGADIGQRYWTTSARFQLAF